MDAFSTREPARVVLPDSDKGRSHLLVHELVHVLTDDGWEALPAFVAEGLADLVAVRLAPDAGGERADMVMLLWRLPGFGLRLTSRPTDSAGSAATCNVEFRDPPLDAPELRDLLSRTATRTIADYEELANAYALGFALASRIVDRRGLPGLRALCETARTAGQALVPPDALLEAAELPADPALWWPLLAPSVGSAELRTLAGRFAQPLAKALLAGLPGTPLEISARAESGLVELSAGGDASVRVSDAPELVQAMHDELATESAATPGGSDHAVEGG